LTREELRAWVRWAWLWTDEPMSDWAQIGLILAIVAGLVFGAEIGRWLAWNPSPLLRRILWGGNEG
jgi:hypothetical protein